MPPAVMLYFATSHTPMLWAVGLGMQTRPTLQSPLVVQVSPRMPAEALLVAPASGEGAGAAAMQIWSKHTRPVSQSARRVQDSPSWLSAAVAVPPSSSPTAAVAEQMPL
jgi:hypothetical protein